MNVVFFFEWKLLNFYLSPKVEDFGGLFQMVLDHFKALLAAGMWKAVDVNLWSASFFSLFLFFLF